MPLEPYRPTVIAIAPEYDEDYFAWDYSPGEAGALEAAVLAGLGASAELLARLRAWNATYAQLPATDFQWRAVQSEEDWRHEGLQLALELQRQLPGVEVHYGAPDDRNSTAPSLRQQVGLPPLSNAPRPASNERVPGAYAYAPLSGAAHPPREAGETGTASHE
ncbi:hypothetical protein GCM10027586_06890 [Kineococcus gypseus]|uniref:hypothetical protein n=1 Tax=Kineococcus gypseus TaxID=1637102 RepID=UPI003D7F0097